ncbi:MAG TPA: LapA family protein [Solirubrobacterales bacterium]|nr:LapA family protein [Solirubrobacterales bacterium]
MNMPVPESCRKESPGIDSLPPCRVAKRVPSVAGEQPSDNEVKLKRYALAKSFVPILYIAALYFPIKATQPIASDLAGKNTHLTLTISITLVFSLAIAAGFLAQLKKLREQAEELRRQRRRIANLEKELDEKGS